MSTHQTTEECAEQIRDYGACDHGPAYPTDEARAALEATSTDGLLTAAYALTHRIHEAERQPADHSVLAFLTVRDEVASLRAQRDAITAEVLRRAGGAS